MQKTPRILLYALVLSLLGGCSLVSGVLGGNVLFQDAFTTSANGWTQGSQPNGTAQTIDGEYQIQVQTANYMLWSNPGKNFGDVQIDVDARKAAGPDDNLYGVICRYQDPNNFYFILVSTDGYYGFGKIVQGERSFIDNNEMTPTTAIMGGVESNHLTATCAGSTLTLTVNGTLVGQVQDSDLKGGDIGLVAGTQNVPGVDIRFDHLVVSRPAAN